MGACGRGLRPTSVKTFQHEWKDRYSLPERRPVEVERLANRSVEGNAADYQKLNKINESVARTPARASRRSTLRLRDLSAKILPCRRFTTGVPMSTPSDYSIETETRGLQKRASNRLASYNKEKTTVSPIRTVRSRTTITSTSKKTYNDLKNERTQMSAELGGDDQAVNGAKEKADACLEHMRFEPHPTQMAGLQDQTEAGTPKILQNQCGRRPTSCRPLANPVTGGISRGRHVDGGLPWR